MSVESLAEIVERSAFDSTPRFEDLWRYHVPFDELAGRRSYERVVAAAARRGERIAVIGASGSGKSSLMSFVSGPLEADIAPIRVPVRTESDAVVTNPRAFAQHVLAIVARRSREANQITDRERTELMADIADRVITRPRQRVVKATFSLPAWLVHFGSLAAEVSSVSSSDAGFDRSGAEVLEQLGRVLELVQRARLFPVLVIDDSDGWLRLEGDDIDRSQVASQFFRQTPRFLAELPCSVLFGVHNQYRELSGYREAADLLSLQVELPILDADGVHRVLAERLNLHCPHVSLGEAFEPAALDILVTHYRGRGAGSLRRVVRLANTAVHLALAEDADIVTEPLIESALADLGPGT
jgi:hypothetical protein